MRSKPIILALCFIALALASTVEIQTMDFQTYMRNLNIQTENFFGCHVWNDDLCDRFDFFKIDKDEKCVLQEEHAKAGCSYFLQIGVCIACKKDWLLRTVVFENMKESSLFCIPEANLVKFEEEKGCQQCNEDYELKDGLCKKVKEQKQMMSDLGCIMMEEGKCKMCWPSYRKNMQGKCVKM